MRSSGLHRGDRRRPRFRTGLVTVVGLSLAAAAALAATAAALIHRAPPARPRETLPAAAAPDIPDSPGGVPEPGAVARHHRHRAAHTPGLPSPVPSPGRCAASFYSPGGMTASGRPPVPGALTAAHPTLPMGSWVRVTNMRNGRSVVVRVNDRGPFVPGRCIDLSPQAMSAIGGTGAGVVPVRYQMLGPATAPGVPPRFAGRPIRSAGPHRPAVPGRSATPGRDAAAGRFATPGRSATSSRSATPVRSATPGASAGSATPGRTSGYAVPATGSAVPGGFVAPEQPASSDDRPPVLSILPRLGR